MKAMGKWTIAGWKGFLRKVSESVNGRLGEKRRRLREVA